MRVCGHGAGGSGKTHCLTRVVIPLYEHFLPGLSRLQAAQNAAARLLPGETMHSRAGLKRNDQFCLQEPSKKIKEKLRQVWQDAALVLNDEVPAPKPLGAMKAPLADHCYKWTLVILVNCRRSQEEARASWRLFFWAWTSTRMSFATGR